MAYEVTIDDENELITIRYSGLVERHDLANAIHALALFDLPYRVLSDYTRVESWHVSAEDLRFIREAVWASGLKISRSALVASCERIHGALAPTVAVREQRYPRALFRDVETALRWLETGDPN